MSAIKYAIDRLSLTIPKEVLQLVFVSHAEGYGFTNNISGQIEDLVVRPIVLKDVNLLSGIKVSIPLENCSSWIYEKNLSTHNMIIQVPYSATGNKRILEPLNLTQIVHYGSGTTAMNLGVAGGGSGLGQKMGSMFRHNEGETELNFGTASLELIGPNTILCFSNFIAQPLTHGYLEVMVENDEDLRNLKPRAYMAFAKMVELATKAYIYNKYTVLLDQGLLYSGREAGKITEIIEGYDSAYEDYTEYLDEEFPKWLYGNDTQQVSRDVKMMLNPYI